MNKTEIRLIQLCPEGWRLHSGMSFPVDDSVDYMCDYIDHIYSCNICKIYDALNDNDE